MSERLIWEAGKVRFLLVLNKEELATLARSKLKSSLLYHLDCFWKQEPVSTAGLLKATTNGWETAVAPVNQPHEWVCIAGHGSSSQSWLRKALKS